MRKIEKKALDAILNDIATNTSEYDTADLATIAIAILQNNLTYNYNFGKDYPIPIQSPVIYGSKSSPIYSAFDGDDESQIISMAIPGFGEVVNIPFVGFSPFMPRNHPPMDSTTTSSISIDDAIDDNKW